MLKQKLPNFLVIGVEKGGTTWLHTQLRKHPDVFVPRTKEIHFFNKYNSNLVAHDHYRYGLKWYMRFFKEYDNQHAVGEVTPMYICDPEAPGRIQALLPDVKIVVMLRNPVSRAYSHFWMAKQKNHTSLSFSEIIAQREPRFVERGLYNKQLSVYYNLFPPENIQVLFFDEVFKNSGFWLSQVCHFIGVDDSYYNGDDTINERVFEASAYKSSFFLNKQNQLIHAMRRSALFSTLLDWLKKQGVSDKIKTLNTVEQVYEKIDEQDAMHLQAFYKDDLSALSSLLRRELPFQFNSNQTLSA